MGKSSQEFGDSLAVQWLRFHVFVAEDLDSITGWETKIPQVVRSKERLKKRVSTEIKAEYPEWKKLLNAQIQTRK